MSQRISLTTTLPYVNSDPHVGHALEFVQADIVARYHRLMGDEVFFNTGTDEHGIKIYRKAEEVGKDVQAYVDEYAARFGLLKEKLDLSYDAFIRTTDPKHISAAQEFWRRCEANGDIYKKEYTVKYCIGCELEKTDSELVDDRCPIHPTTPIELIAEENYFFRFSKYQEPLLALYTKHPDFVVPVQRLNEIRSFVERGLQDFSISRLKSKMPWGIEVPSDNDHVMYVWFDALVNYISTLDWPDEKYAEWWPSVQFAGKDNLRQQSAMWQAMLMSAGVAPSKQIFIHGFITSGGQKMSKSIGNVINPLDLVATYGTDTLRYYLARHVHPFEDSDLTVERFHERYTADLVNGLGNLVSRVMKLAETHLEKPIPQPDPVGLPEEYVYAIEHYEFNVAMDYIWKRIGDADERMTSEAPFKVVKTNLEEGKRIIHELVLELYTIGLLLSPFMPATSTLIKETVLANKKPETMFPRIEQ
ncbi:MAG: methionine--tRNA ligase [Candidatus Pacebacteria bacterium]|nr:methionine--tRNA ligase [Candidatus Paceibacterota bacterium]